MSIRRRLHGAVAAAALASAAPVAASAQDAGEDPKAAIESCIRANAVRVEQAFDSLIEATAFLTQSVCLKPVADAAAALQRAEAERRSAQLDEVCARLENEDPFSPLAGRYGAECQSRDLVGDEDEVRLMIRYGPQFAAGQTPPEMVSLAATLLLDARLARRGADE